MKPDSDLEKRSTHPSHPPPANPAPPHAPRAPRLRWLEARLLGWLPATSVAVMIYCSIMAIYQSKGDPGTVAFIAASLSILAGLYWSIKEFERAVAQRAAARKERLKVAIWLLAMALNTLFSYRVTTVMDSAVFSLIIWAITAATTIVGYYLMFSSLLVSD